MNTHKDKKEIEVDNDVFYFPWHKRLEWKIKETVHRFILWILNLTNKDYYDFGERIVSTTVFKNNLIIGTEHKLFLSKDGKTFERVDRKDIIK